MRSLPALGSLLAALLPTLAQPVFLHEPVGASVSLGVDVYLYALAYGPSPITYQWRKDGVPLQGETIELLILAPVQPGDVGYYDVIASDPSGSITSQVARVALDTTFTKITRSPVVEAIGPSRGCAWGDFDQDGLLDLFIATDSRANDFLFRNLGGGGFEAVTNSPVVRDAASTYSGAWGDWNNDGYLELYAANYNTENDAFYVNSNGVLTKLLTTPVSTDGMSTFGGAWADVDGDGWLDLLTVHFPRYGFGFFYNGTNYFLLNNRDGTFTRSTAAPGNDGNMSFFTAPSFTDYDNDGRLDIAIARLNRAAIGLYRNTGNGYESAAAGALVSDRYDASGVTWADYDNDGWIDAFVTAGLGSSYSTNGLYRNLGNGTFERIYNALGSHAARNVGASWGDYDNDGWIDMFLPDLDGRPALYRNLGNGEFVPVMEGSLVNDIAPALACSWADYDKDGFLDLIVSTDSYGSLLYRNNGNSNAWLKVTPRGRQSNRLGIGARVQVLANLQSVPRWQLREITGGNAFSSQPLLAHFGLGDAAEATLVRVTWPSGLVQELDQVQPRQELHLVEPELFVWPKDPGAVVGGNFTFAARGSGSSWQWRFNGQVIPGETGPSLTLTQVTEGSFGSYSVVSIENGQRVFSAPVVLRPAVKPAFVTQPSPTNLQASLGVTVTYKFVVTGTEPLMAQWQLNGSNLPGATNSALALVITNVSQSGSYTVIVTNHAGSATSRVLVVTVDDTFTKLFTGPLVTDVGYSMGAAWLAFAPEQAGIVTAHSGVQSEFAYLSQGDGVFVRAAGGVLSEEGGDTYGLAAGDFDNDGFMDLFCANNTLQNDVLYRGLGNGTFAKVTNSPLSADGVSSYSAAWADYDRDGWLDLYVAMSGADALYHGLGGGVFMRLTNAPVTTDGGASRGCTWADYDNDGLPDLFVCNSGAASFLYRNLGGGSFVRVSTNAVGADTLGGNGAAWGDFDNDGDLDLFVARNGADLLYRNEGAGVFTKLSGMNVVTDGGNSATAAWADFNNDGWLDLFVANTGSDFLYRNNGNGTFTRITTGSVVNDGVDSRGIVWNDFNGDGWLDLFVAHFNQTNGLYLNSGKGNHWLSVKCVGGTSNRSAIGAKVRVQAVLGGQTLWQLRELSSGDGFGSQTPLAHFGLAESAEALAVRVEWPSGQVTELAHVPADQHLVIHESSPAAARPGLEIRRLTDGCVLQVHGVIGAGCIIEASDDLCSWEPVTDLDGDGPFTVETTGVVRRFYRAVQK